MLVDNDNRAVGLRVAAILTSRKHPVNQGLLAWGGPQLDQPELPIFWTPNFQLPVNRYEGKRRIVSFFVENLQFLQIDKGKGMFYHQHYSIHIQVSQ